METENKEEPASTLADSSEDETVVFTLQGVPFTVNIKKLLKESLYFKSLILGDYKDSRDEEFHIEYPINPDTFKTFLDWLDDENINGDIFGYYYSTTLLRYETRYYKELLDLLRFATYYAIDRLLNSLSYLLISRWTIPTNLIELWLIAEELNLEDLKQGVFAICLDLFESIPQDEILSLPKDNFDVLVRNINLRCPESYRQKILDEWAKRNEDDEEINQRGKNNQQCAKCHKVKENIKEEEKSSEDHVKHKTEEIVSLGQENNGDNADLEEYTSGDEPSKYLHCFTVFKDIKDYIHGSVLATTFSWDGIVLEELLQMTDGCKNFVQTGTQIIGRGYSIYVVGGEKFLGKGTFNLYITRYCLLTRKWYKVQRLLTERRHMVAEFMGNKLVIVGGVGKYRVKLNSVHILDIHTSVWTTGQDIPQSFTKIPPSCVVGNRLLLGLSYLYSYDIVKNNWTVIIPTYSPHPMRYLKYFNNKVFAFVQTNCTEPIKIKTYKILSKDEDTRYAFINQGDIVVESNFKLVLQDDCIVFFIIKDGKIAVEIGKLTVHSYQRLMTHFYDKPDDTYFKSNTGCFRVLNPFHIFTQIDEETSS